MKTSDKRTVATAVMLHSARVLSHTTAAHREAGYLAEELELERLSVVTPPPPITPSESIF